MYPAGEPGVSVQYVTLASGLRVRVLEAGPPSDHAVLLVHGWGASVYSYSAMLPALANAGFRAIAIDLPGFGLSDKPTDEMRYTTEASAEVVREVVTAMGVARFTFVGHSLGGALGLHLATTGEHRLDRLVLINAVGLGSVFTYPIIRVLSPRIVDRILPALLTRRLIHALLRLAFATPDRPTKRDIDEYWAPTQFDEFTWACRAVLHRAKWSRVPATRLRSLRLPVLVIVGARDRLVRDTARRAQLIPGARVVTIRDGGHVVLQECSVRSNAALIEFLRSAPTPRR